MEAQGGHRESEGHKQREGIRLVHRFQSHWRPYCQENPSRHAQGQVQPANGRGTEKGSGHGSIEVVSLEQAHVDLDAELTLNREQWRAKETKIAELKDASLQRFVLDS